MASANGDIVRTTEPPRSSVTTSVVEDRPYRSRQAVDSVVGPGPRRSMISAIRSGMVGMERQVARLEQSAMRTARGPGASDPVVERVEQIAAHHAFSASGALVRTADEMLGTLLDIVA
jgi:hypothetical protein